MTDDILDNLNSYLTFRLGNETFAANVGKVVEILEVPHITKVPRAPVYMPGVINLRGDVLPLIDTRLKFGLNATEFNVDTCVVVLEVAVDGEQLEIGALVDSVQEVIEITADQIKDPPSMGANFETEFLIGMGKIGDDFILMLDIDKVFSTKEIINLKTSTDDVATEEA